MDPAFIILFAVFTFLLAGTIKGAIGVGMPTAAIGIMSQVIDPKTAVALVVFPTMVSNVWQTYRMGDTVRAFWDYWRFAAALIVVLWLTTFLTASVSQQTMMLMIGGVVVTFAVTNLALTPPPIPDQWNHTAQIVFGSAAGLLGGLTATWATPVVVYLLARRLEKDEFIRASGLLISIGSIPLLIGFWQNGLIDESTAWLSLLMVVPALLGFRVGEVIRARLPVAQFQKAVLVAFLLMGLNIIRRGLM